MAEKRCTRCGLTKDEDEFNWRWKMLGIRQSVCRDCSKLQRSEHYEKYRDQEIKRVYEITKDKREKAHAFVWDYLSNSTCIVCGEYDPMVLQFDHVRGEKKMDVSQMAAQGYSIEAIQAEISKCEVVCANCHQRREIKRRGKPRW